MCTRLSTKVANNAILAVFQTITYSSKKHEKRTNNTFIPYIVYSFAPDYMGLRDVYRALYPYIVLLSVLFRCHFAPFFSNKCPSLRLTHAPCTISLSILCVPPMHCEWDTVNENADLYLARAPLYRPTILPPPASILRTLTANGWHVLSLCGIVLV